MMHLNQYAATGEYFWEDEHGSRLSDLFGDKATALLWALKRGFHIAMGDEEALLAIPPDAESAEQTPNVPPILSRRDE